MKSSELIQLLKDADENDVDMMVMIAAVLKEKYAPFFTGSKICWTRCLRVCQSSSSKRLRKARTCSRLLKLMLCVD